MKKISRRGAEYAEKKHSGLLDPCFSLRLCAFAGNFFFSLPQSRKVAKRNQLRDQVLAFLSLCASVREFFFFSHRGTKITEKNRNFLGFVFLCVLCASARNFLSPEAL